jgi:release factor glutamine methyltransferase
MRSREKVMKLDTSIVVNCPENVYCPSDDTFLLIDALEIVPGDRALEVGCGSGLVSLHMAKAGAVVTAIDVNYEAAICAKAAASLNGLRLEVIRSDLFQNVKGCFDLIVFNPPYLRGEGTEISDLAWAGGRTGTETLARFLEQAPAHLNPSGRIVVIVSSDMEPTPLKEMLDPFQLKELRAQHLFFEELRVLELRPREIMS